MLDSSHRIHLADVGANRGTPGDADVGATFTGSSEVGTVEWLGEESRRESTGGLPAEDNAHTANVKALF
jgi:hypothetical protein